MTSFPSAFQKFSRKLFQFTGMNSKFLENRWRDYVYYYVIIIILESIRDDIIYNNLINKNKKISRFMYSDVVVLIIVRYKSLAKWCFRNIDKYHIWHTLYTHLAFKYQILFHPNLNWTIIDHHANEMKNCNISLSVMSV